MHIKPNDFRSKLRRLRRDARTIVVIAIGIAVACMPIYGLYSLWSYCIDQVPVAHEWAGLIKAAITLAVIVVGGGLTAVLTFWAVVAGLALIAWLA